MERASIEKRRCASARAGDPVSTGSGVVRAVQCAVALFLLVAAARPILARSNRGERADPRTSYGRVAARGLSGDLVRISPHTTNAILRRRDDAYCQMAGKLRRPDDRRYQFAVSLKLQDGGFGNTSDVDVKVTDRAVYLKEHLTLRFDIPRQDARRGQFKRRVKQAVAELLDDRLEMVQVRGGKRLPLRLSVELHDQPPTQPGDPTRTERATIEVKAGSGRSDAATLYLEDSTRVIAHELVHRMLAAPDEYIDAESKIKAPDRNPRHRDFKTLLGFDPGSLMRCTYDSPTLLPYHGAAVARLLGRLTGEKHVVALKPEHRFVSTRPREEVLETVYSRAQDALEKQLDRRLTRAGWREYDRDPIYAPKGSYPEFRRGLIKYLAYEKLSRFRRRDLARKLEPKMIDRYQIVRALGAMVGSQTLERLATKHGAKCVEKLEERLASRITPAGRQLIDGGRTRRPLREVLESMDWYAAAEKSHDLLIRVYGTTPQTEAIRAQIRDNVLPPLDLSSLF
jgi:hypothetical protein